MRESICYTRIYKHPIKIYSFSTSKQQLTISKKGIEIYRIIFSAAMTLFFYIFLRGIIDAVIPSLLSLVFYFGVPYYLSSFLTKKKEGKNLFRFIRLYIQYRLFLKSTKYVVVRTRKVQDTYRIDGDLLHGDIYYEGLVSR